MMKKKNKSKTFNDDDDDCIWNDNLFFTIFMLFIPQNETEIEESKILKMKIQIICKTKKNLLI